jgi:hypothetical protein
VFDYFPAMRSGERVTVKGDKPFYNASFTSGSFASRTSFSGRLPN